MQLFLQTYGENRNSGFILDTYGKLCVLTKTTDNVSHNSLNMNCSDVDGCVVQLWGKGEVPGATLMKVSDHDSDAPVWGDDDEVSTHDSDASVWGDDDSGVLGAPVAEMSDNDWDVSEHEDLPLSLALDDPRRVSFREPFKARQNNSTTAFALCDPPLQRRKTDRGVLLVNSDGHPVRRGSRMYDYRDDGTPLWDNFLTNLSMATDHDNGRDFVEFMHKHFFHKDLLWVDANGEWLDYELPLGSKMETLFDTAWRRRKLALEHLWYYGSAERWESIDIADQTYELTNEEMKDLLQLQLLERCILIVCAMGGGRGPPNLESEITKLKHLPQCRNIHCESAISEFAVMPS